MKRRNKNSQRKENKRKESSWKSFFKPNNFINIIFVVILVINLLSVYLNFYNRCDGPFCPGIINSLLFTLFSLPLAIFYKMAYSNILLGLILLIISFFYNYSLACLINYNINKMRRK